MKRLVVLISGRGSNMESLVRNAQDYQVVGVVSDQPEAAGLKFAQENGIPTFSHGRANFASLRKQKEAIYTSVSEFNADIIALAGFMQIVAADFTERVFGKLINIHPSLLPELPGLDTHSRALKHEHKVHGCTVHYVDSGLDTGPIIAQAQVPVNEGDTESTLAARVLVQEHKLYPWVANSIASGRIWLEKGASEGPCVKFDQQLVIDAGERGFAIPR